MTVGPRVVAAIGMTGTSPITRDGANIPVVAAEFQWLGRRENCWTSAFYDRCRDDRSPCGRRRVYRCGWMKTRIDQQHRIFISQMRFRTPRRISANGSKRACDCRLHPPGSAVRIDDNLLAWANTDYTPRNSLDLLTAPLCRGRDLRELDCWQRARVRLPAATQKQTRRK